MAPACLGLVVGIILILGVLAQPVCTDKHRHKPGILPALGNGVF